VGQVEEGELRRFVIVTSLVGLAGACSAIPDVEYRYYPSKMTLTVSVTQAIDCSSDKTALIVANAASITPNYSADFTKGPYRIRIRDIEGAVGGVADSDATFSFYDDGRLKSINQSTTGQGEAVIKSAVTLAAGFIAGAAPGAAAPKVLDVCTVIANLGGGKGVNLTYGTVISYQPSQKDALYDLPVSPASQAIYDKIRDSLPKLQVIVDKATPTESGAGFLAQTSGSDGDVVDLTLQKTASVKVDVTSQGASFASSNVVAPADGTYTLPIPKAALFGKQSLGLTLSEAGAITTVDYGKLSGAPGALNAANAVATTESQSTAARAAEVKAQGDLIAAQQRLLRCQVKPAQCQ
jgi:hypothetical protein